FGRGHVEVALQGQQGDPDHEEVIAVEEGAHGRQDDVSRIALLGSACFSVPWHGASFGSGLLRRMCGEPWCPYDRDSGPISGTEIVSPSGVPLSREDGGAWVGGMMTPCPRVRRRGARRRAAG